MVVRQPTPEMTQLTIVGEPPKVEVRQAKRPRQRGRRLGRCRQMEPMLELEQPVMELEAGKYMERVRRWAEVAALDFGLAQGQGRELRRVQQVERVEAKQQERMEPTTRLNLG